MQPLKGMRVLDLTRAFAGPFCAQILSDLGADVIKLERPVVGDETRSWGPPFAKDPAGHQTAETGYFFCVNRGKRSLTLDISKPEAREILVDLIQQSDVLIENYKVGTLARYGLGWEDVRAVNPRLVYCSITGFGLQGPYSTRPGYDFIIQAMGGLMSVTGEAERKPGGGPQKVGVPVVDMMTGLYATIAIQAALTARQNTNTGQRVDVNLLDVLISALANQAQNYLLTGRVPHCAGNFHPNIVPQGVMTTKDGRLVVLAGNNAQFKSLCAAIGHSELAKDPRFLDNPSRVGNFDALNAILADAFATRTTAEWSVVLEAANVPHGPINDMAAVFADPHVIERGMRFDMPHSVCGSIPQIASPMRFSETPVAYHLPPPVLGEHNEEILTELLGIPADRLRHLRGTGIV